MEEPTFSLLYPDEAAREKHENRVGVPNISSSVCDELGLSGMFDLRASSLEEFFTSDAQVIRYRQQTFSDLLALPQLLRTLTDVYPILSDITELRRMDEGGESGSSFLYSITEIELYVSCIKTLADGLLPLRDKMKSRALCALTDFIAEYSASEYYVELNRRLDALSERVRDVRSITVGVNLDAKGMPESAGIVNVNAEPFKSGKMLDKILRLSFRNDAFTCIAPLSAMGKAQNDNKREAMNAALHSALDDVFRASVRSWRNIVGEYVLDNTDFLLRMLPEIEFVCRSCEVIRRLKEHDGCTVVFPTLCPPEEKVFRAKDLFNPRVALAVADTMVTNDFAFDEQGQIYILTGPNRGGKSVITVAVGAAQAMFQLGLPVCASEASLSAVDGIYTHFPEGADDTIDKGRLGEECARLHEIFEAVSARSMILCDESLSSTGAYEASFIATEILTAFAAVRCRGIFSTHLHELAAAKDEINERSAALGGVRVDTLVAGMSAGARSFRIERRAPDGKSYASDIAAKYGLSLDALTEKVKEKNKLN